MGVGQPGWDSKVRVSGEGWDSAGQIAGGEQGGRRKAGCEAARGVGGGSRRARF